MKSRKLKYYLNFFLTKEEKMEENNENETNSNSNEQPAKQSNVEQTETTQTDSKPNKSKKKTGVTVGVIVAIVVIFLILAILVVGGIFLVTKYVFKNGIDNQVSNTNSNTSITSQEENNQENGTQSNSTLPIVEMTLGDGKVVKMELYPEYAPNTVANFLDLVSSGFYDGLTFHRLVKGFVLQGGDPEGTGSGSNDYSIKGEFSKNGYEENTLKHTTGILSMARADYSTVGSSLNLSSDLTEDLTEEGYNSAYSQFFIMLAPNTALDGNYAAFGKVIEGMNYIEDIAQNRNYTIEDANGTIKADEQPKIVKMTMNDTGKTYLEKYGKVKRQSSFDYSGFVSEAYNYRVNSSSNNSKEAEKSEEKLNEFFEHTEQK